MSHTLILSIGNLLRHDDGVGPIVLKLLSEYPKPNVDYANGGTDGLALIDLISSYKKVTIIDAVNMQMPPGTIKRFKPKDAKIHVKSDVLSTHGFGLVEVLDLLVQLGVETEIDIIGIQPKDISLGEGLSDCIRDCLNDVITLVAVSAQS